MASQPRSTSSDQMIFTFDQVARGDGSFVVTPRAIVEDREISVTAAAKILGFRNKKTIYGLRDAGEIAGWKPESQRGNQRYRISWRSVIDYKQRMQAAG